MFVIIFPLCLTVLRVHVLIPEDCISVHPFPFFTLLKQPPLTWAISSKHRTSNSCWHCYFDALFCSCSQLSWSSETNNAAHSLLSTTRALGTKTMGPKKRHTCLLDRKDTMETHSIKSWSPVGNILGICTTSLKPDGLFNKGPKWLWGLFSLLNKNIIWEIIKYEHRDGETGQMVCLANSI